MYSISEEWPEPLWQDKMDLSLFSKRKYWEIRQSETDFLPLLITDSFGTVVSFWCFALLNNEWRTPYKAPYFEPYISDKNLLQSILTEVCNYLKLKKQQSVRISFPPIYFCDTASTVLNGKYNFEIEKVEVSSLLNVSADFSFHNQIQQNRKKRKLRQLLNSDFLVREAEANDWDKLYGYLLEWRKSKGHQNLIPKNLILKAKEHFPNEYKMLKLMSKNELAGLALIIKVKRNLFYVYALIANPLFDKHSPSLLLWNAIYELAKEQKVELIDLGTSMLKATDDNFIINRGLLKNKMAMGSSTTKKYTIKC